MTEGMTKKMTSDHLKEMNDMEPAHFDRHFVTMMISHYQGALSLLKRGKKMGPKICISKIK